MVNKETVDKVEVNEETLQRISVALRAIVIEKGWEASFEFKTGSQTFASLLEEVGYPDVSWL